MDLGLVAELLQGSGDGRSNKTVHLAPAIVLPSSPRSWTLFTLDCLNLNAKLPLGRKC
ncbi:hypothetical protein ACN4EG_16055 [Alkalinema pantanalense CENA528]|uniref:hypothetical protein n=1 Tax=Alkalinema pantanalense TaxID=1620705 RepID=UPI003D701B18